MKRIALIICMALCHLVVKGQSALDTLAIPYSQYGFTTTMARSMSDLESGPDGEIWISFRSRGLFFYDGQTWSLIDRASTNQQLPSDTVHSVYRSSNGALWIATEAGLVQLQSAAFTVYPYPSPINFPANWITSLEQQGGKLWMGTLQGVLQLDTLSGAWTNITTGNSALPNDTVNSLYVDENEKIWAATNSGYAVIDNGQITSFTTTHTGMPLMQIRHIAVTSFDTLFISRPYGLLRKKENQYYLLDSMYYGYLDAQFCDADFGALEWKKPSNMFYSRFAVDNKQRIYTYRHWLPDDVQENGLICIDTTRNLLLTKLDLNVATGLPRADVFTELYRNDTLILHNFSTGYTDLFFVGTRSTGSYSPMKNLSADLQLPTYYEFDIPESYKGRNQENLVGNMMSVRLLNRGDMHWDPIASVPLYEVPRTSGKVPLYNSGIWLGGYDQQGNLYVAAQTYRQNANMDFWPGPLDTIGKSDTATLRAFDHIWMARKADIDEFRYQYAAGNVQNGAWTVPDFIKDWPAFHNNPAYPQKLAPFVDVDADGSYDPFSGDYPKLEGDQMAWWVFNDDGNKTGSGNPPLFPSPPLNIEVQASAWIYHCNAGSGVLSTLLNYTSFYRFELINRSNRDYDSCFFGLFIEFDIGNPADDFAGCHIGNNTFFVYNGDSLDEGSRAYGDCPPFQNVSFLRCPEAPSADGIDNDHNGLTDESQEETGLYSFLRIVDGPGPIPTTFPSTPQEHYNYLRGYWLNNQPITYGGNGLGGGIGGTTVPSPLMFPDSSNLAFSAPWTMATAGLQPDDMLTVASAGRFHLPAGASRTFELAYVTGPNNRSYNNALIADFRNRYRSGQIQNYSGYLPALQGPDAVGGVGTAYTYVLPYNSPNGQYLWTVSNGIIQSGQGTDSVQVIWGSSGEGEVSVEVLEPNNPCSQKRSMRVQVGNDQPDNDDEEAITCRVYPNPSREAIQLESGGLTVTQIRVWSVQGQLMIRQAYTGRYDTSTLPTGAYLMEFIGEDGNTVCKKLFVRY